jgi:DNA-binding NtrC family response regulator
MSTAVATAQTMLVIDDDEAVLQSCRRIFEEAGYAVTVANKAVEGLRLAGEDRFDVILCDWMMPGLDGMDVVRELDHRTPSSAVVMITGYPSTERASEAMSRGALDFVAKPFTPDGLVEAVRTALAKAGAAAPEEQRLVHRVEVLRVLERAATDSSFVADLFYHGADALEEFDLTAAEKLAILTADVHWIEANVGKLEDRQRRWLDERLAAEVW